MVCPLIILIVYLLLMVVHFGSVPPELGTLTHL